MIEREAGFSWEDGVGTIRRTAVVWVALALVLAGAKAQESDATQEAYFRAVGEFFDVPSFELEILRDWSLPPDEIPVVLFVAERAGVVPEALVALRRSGESWARLAERYGVGAPEFHVPVPDQAATGPLNSVYQRFRELPTSRWREIRLSPGDIVALVNVRLLSQTLGIAPAEVLSLAGSTSSFVQLYGELIR
jgi:hypothetical protein